MSKEIKLTKGYVAIVDDEDFDRLSKRKWQASEKPPWGTYASGCIGGGVRSSISMHRYIMNAKPGQMVDHRNGNRLDNRKENLRFCTHSENMANRGKAKGKTSKYLGVFYCKGTARRGSHIKAWKFALEKDGKVYARCFKTEEEAARGYNLFAIKHHGEFAKLNFPPPINHIQ